MRYGAAFVLISDEHVLLQRRPDKGLLGGMMGFPGTDWGPELTEPMTGAPIARNWEKCEGEVKHVFTHFELRLDVYRAEITNRDAEGIWAPLVSIKSFALPTVMTKVLSLAQK